MHKERGEEKGPPHTLKEKEVQKEIPAVPESAPVHRAGGHARTDIYSREDESGTIMQDEVFQLIGTNLALGEEGKIEVQLADTEEPETWYNLTSTASNIDAERIRLSDLAWETLGPDVQVSTDHSRFYPYPG